MMLTDDPTQPAAAMPLAAFKAHLHLGTAFDDSALPDDLLTGFLRAAMAAIEGRIGKILLERGLRLELSRWAGATGQPLPVAPVTAITALVLRDADGSDTPVLPARWRLERDQHRTVLRAAGGVLPAIPTGGSAILHLRAGIAPDWAALPADLAQAVLLLAAHFYEYRQDTGLGPGCMPFGVASLIDRHRNLRIGLSGSGPHGAA